jgi:hypothetical protein
MSNSFHTVINISTKEDFYKHLYSSAMEDNLHSAITGQAVGWLSVLDRSTSKQNQKLRQYFTNEERFLDAFESVMAKKSCRPDDYRVYASLSPCVLDSKSRMVFMARLLQDSLASVPEKKILTSLDSFIGSNVENDRYMLDVDSKEPHVLSSAIERVAASIQSAHIKEFKMGYHFTLYVLNTKKGYHVITPRFNKTIFDNIQEVEVKSQCLVCIDYLV